MARTVRVGIACVLLASACTGGGSDDEPQDEGAAVSSTATSVEGGTTGDLTVAEPTPLFTAVDVPEFVTEGDHIEINAAIPLGGTTWLAIAMLDQPEARRRDPLRSRSISIGQMTQSPPFSRSMTQLPPK